MRRFVAIAIFSLLGCASVSTLPVKKDAEKASVAAAPALRAPLPSGQANAEILKAEHLAPMEKISLWRAWAADASQPLLQAHALSQLTWIDDSERLTLATKAFESTYPRVRTIAARVLTSSPSSPAIRTALLDAFQAATDEERGAIAWALVIQGEKAIASKALEELRSGGFAKVVDLDGRHVYDALALAELFSLNEMLAHTKDAHPAVRQMAARRFAWHQDARTVEVLLPMLQDADDRVSAIAAGGLAHSGDKRGHEAVLDALRKANNEQRAKLLEGIRDIAGGPGLVLALESIPAKPEETAWFQTKEVFDLLKNLADPRVTDPLFAWTSAAKRHPHWLGEAGTRLAEVGDLRAAKLLADRLRLDPTKLYSTERFWEASEFGHLSRTDLPRIVGARMLADLAFIHRDKHTELLAAAEAATLEWLGSSPQPHANGLRFLAAAGSNKGLKDLRQWAFPSDPLPAVGATPPFPTAFETAQTALRYIGLRKDEPSFPKLLAQLQRKKDKSLNITQDGLMDGGMAMLGMSLRAIGYGAATGLAHWGDVRAVGPLMTFIEDETWHEEARQAACEALAWCVDGKTMAEVARKAQTFGESTLPAKQFIGACYAETLSLRPMPEIVPQLVEALGPRATAEARMAYARAIGVSGFDAESREKLFRKLEDPASRQAAALALILGGDADTAMRAVATMAEFGTTVLDELKDNYYRAFGYWKDVDFERGNLYRWMANAEAIGHVEVSGVMQAWGRDRLRSQLANLQFDNGPHSETRVVLRSRLVQDAKTGTVERKRGAILTLEFMQEQGVLLALGDEPGETGDLARRALHRVMQPLSKLAQ